MSENRVEQFSRNLGFIDKADQGVLSNSTVVIAGVGGVGGRLAVELARLGVGALRIADPDIFTVTNLNRQEGSGHSTLGKSKSQVIAQICRDINPAIKIEHLDDGIDEATCAAFTKDANIVVEATDFKLPYLGVMLARAARQNNIPMVMGTEIGFGATIIWFDPHKYTYEEYLGLSKNVDLLQMKSGKVSVDFSRWIPHVPAYGKLKVLRAVAAGETDAPAIMPAVDLCAAMASTLIVGHLTKMRVQPPAPATYHFDAHERKSRLIRFPRIHYVLSLSMMMLRNAISK